ncbi:STAS domain-containing protein [Cocleimonas flava]|uniref:Anti-sigma factor antagonist n=1 Tax=Cocleimonas flava TaxID=634765 RepID=A0A4R1F3F3_9GAMM|nr:STAS domain-containing protein [Cocleimonas flava]TCJ86959.1 anti-sigma B factor antagonist [Cocleimonas flava]
MNLAITENENITVVTVKEARLDASIAPEFKKQMEELINNDKDKIILDISEIGFMDSSSLGALVGVLKAMGNNGKLIVCGASGVVLELFKLTRMDRIFTLADDMQAAKSAFVAEA